MNVHVTRITVPAGSSIGYGYGKDDAGKPVKFAGDHRMMRYLGEVLADAAEPPIAEVESWQIIRG